MKKIVNEFVDVWVEVPGILEILLNINSKDRKKLTSPSISAYNGLLNFDKVESNLYSVISFLVRPLCTGETSMYVRFENRTSKSNEYILNEIWEDYCQYLNNCLGDEFTDQVEKIRKLWY